MKRILTLVVVALSILVSFTAFAKPTRAPIRLDKAKVGHVIKAKKLKPRLKVSPKTLQAAMGRGAAAKAKPAKVTRVKPRIRLPGVKAR